MADKKKASVKNTFRSEKTKKKSKRQAKGVVIPKINSGKVSRILGLLVLTFSLFLFFALLSYIFNWKYDQSVVDQSKFAIKSFEQVRSIVAHNWTGIIGAYLAHFFIAKTFGIASFIWIIIFLMLGVKLLFEDDSIRLSPGIYRLFFVMLWISLSMGFLFHSSYNVLAGGFGLYGYVWLRGLLGMVGGILLLLLILSAYIIIVFNIKFWIPDLFKAKNNTADSTEVIHDLDDEGEEDSEENLVEIIEKDETETVVELEDEPEFETKVIDQTEKKDANQDEENGVDFVIEKAEEKEEDAPKSAIGDLPQYDPTLDLSNYKYPTLDLLKDYGDEEGVIDEKELGDKKNLIVQTLRNYGIEIEKIKATVGSTVTLYEIVPIAGVRISKIKNLEDDIALSLAALGIRIIAPIPGKGTIGIEVPNTKPEIVSMHSVISSSKFANAKMELPFVLGRTISNEVFMADLAKLPHLLIAGATGQGKSVGLNVIINSLLFKKHPSQIKFVMVDPKKVELSLYSKIEKHFLAKLPDNEDGAIITDVTEVVNTLQSLTQEMDARYLLLKDAHVRNIVEYNRKFMERKLNPEHGHRYLPYIVLVIDELADLMMTAGKEIEMPIARLAQLARAIGIHLILATQRPSVNIITGTIKANFPARIAFKVSAAVDSRTILDAKGAEQLIGRGDMLFSAGSDLVRIQCAFIDTPEVENVVDFISEQQAYPSAHVLPEVISEGSASGGKSNDLDDLDALFEDAARIVVINQQGSTSLIQRRLKLGYNRAGRIIDQLEAAGIVGPFEGSKARQVLIPDEYALEQFLNDFRNK